MQMQILSKKMNVPVDLRRRAGGWLGHGWVLALLLSHQAATLSYGAGIATTWGYNNAGQVSPIPDGAKSGVVAVAGGSIHSLALRSDGTVVAWGDDSYNQVDVPADLANVVAIAGGAYHSLALKADGTVAFWGKSETLPGGLTNVVGIAAGGDHSLAVRSDGTVLAWGDNSSNESTAPVGPRNGVAVAAGDHFSVALWNDGTISAWGDNTYNQTNVPVEATNVLAIAANGGHCLALRRDGTVVAWGRNDAGQATVPANLSNVVAIAAGALHSLALRADGTLAGWGDNTHGQSGTGAGQANYCGIGAGGYHSLAIWGDGSPCILLQPASQVVPFGHDARFEALAAGLQPITYQWQKNGLNLPGATTNSYVVPNVQLTDGATFTLILSNSLGVTVSRPAVLTPIGVLPWIVAQPPNSTNLCGDTAILQVTADGPRPLGYQWQFQGLPLSGATLTSLSLANVSAAQAGGYSVVVTDAYGSITSSPGNLTVIVTPTITNQPQAVSVYCGRDASFLVSATGPSPLSYQWLFTGTPIAGATAPVLGLTGVTNGQDGPYSVAVACPCGSVTSAVAYLTLLAIPVITNQPQPSLVAFCGDTVTNSVGATGPTPLSYQWFFGGAPMPDATNATLILPGVTNGNVGQYSAVVSCACGAITSSVATLAINPEPPLITSSLTNAAVQGQPFAYAITALHNPVLYISSVLPPGLTLNPTNGIISGSNFESGTFYIRLGTVNACAGDSKLLRLDVSSSAPAVTSATNATGTAGANFSYTIAATQSPTSFSAQNLPPGLLLNQASGVIAGIPAYAGEYDATLAASNPWGTGSGQLHISIGYGQVTGLSIVNVHTNYSKPYLLDIQFGLRDNNDPTMGDPLVVDPGLLSVAAFEDTNQVDPSETAFILKRVIPGALKVKLELVLDFSESIGSIALNGDSNGNGISDSVEAEVTAAETFVTQQPASTQIGVWEFHRKDLAPNRVVGLTNETAAFNAIAGIWTNYINYNETSSRCWNALVAAIKDLGANNSSEMHAVIFVSDGNDNSSTSTVLDVIKAATNANVQVYCVGFGQNINTANLQEITGASGGTYLTGQTAADLAGQFAQIGKVFTGLYRLRWVTPKICGAPIFMPSFSITYNGLTAVSPTNPWWVSNYDIITTNIDPTTSNATYVTNSYSTNVTNFTVFSPYDPCKYAGDVNVGLLHLQPNATLPSTASLYADYLPPYIRQFNLHFRLNWPGTMAAATNAADLLAGWTATPTDDGSNGTWLLLSAPDPYSGPGVQTNSLAWGSFGEVVDFSFRDAITTNTAFGIFGVDTNLYALTNNTPGYTGQGMSNYLNGMVTNLPTLPYGTPVGWLMANGFTDPTTWTNAETLDSDNDGMLNWQEYQANTYPKDPTSRLAITSVSVSPLDGRWQVTFRSALFRTYQVLATTDLVTWRVVQDGISGTGANITVLDTTFVPSVQTYYRLRVYRAEPGAGRRVATP